MADYAVVVTLSLAKGEAPPSAWHGWLYRALGERGDPYHRDGTPPFTLQSVEGWSRVRAVLLEGTLAGNLGLSPGSEGPGGSRVKQVEWEIQPYRRILDEKPSSSDLILDFVTPVAFRQGPLTMFVPLPRLLFGGLKRIWDRFVRLPLAEFDPVACDRDVEMPWLDLTTRRLDIGLGSVKGAVGRVTYRCQRPELTSSLWALAAFSELAGAGVKRAFGMGGVRFSRRGVSRSQVQVRSQ